MICNQCQYAGSASILSTCLGSTKCCPVLELIGWFILPNILSLKNSKWWSNIRALDYESHDLQPLTPDIWKHSLFSWDKYNHKIKRSCPGSRPEWGEPTAKLMEPQLVWGLDRSFSLWGATTSSRWVSEMVSLTCWWGRIIKTAETCGPECWPQVVPADWTLSLRLYSCFVIDLNILSLFHSTG